MVPSLKRFRDYRAVGRRSYIYDDRNGLFWSCEDQKFVPWEEVDLSPKKETKKQPTVE